MKLRNKLFAALCLALMMCLMATAALPAGFGALNAAQAATTIKLNKTKATLYNGKTLKLKVSGTSKAVTWTSTNAAVAKVSAKGVVTAKKVGQADILAKVGGKTLTCKVTVKAPLSADTTNVTLKVGETKKVTLTWQLTGSVSMKSYDASILSCTFGSAWKNKKNTLTIKGISAGTQTLAFKNSKTSDVLRIKVTVTDSGSSKYVDKTSVTVKKGKTTSVKVKKIGSDMPHPYWDPDMLHCEFGKWDKDGWPLYIKGLAKGETEIDIYKGDTGKVVATIKVTVE